MSAHCKRQPTQQGDSVRRTPAACRTCLSRGSHSSKSTKCTGAWQTDNQQLPKHGWHPITSRPAPCLLLSSQSSAALGTPSNGATRASAHSAQLQQYTLPWPGKAYAAAASRQALAAQTRERRQTGRCEPFAQPGNAANRGARPRRGPWKHPRRAHQAGSSDANSSCAPSEPAAQKW